MSAGTSAALQWGVSSALPLPNSHGDDRDVLAPRLCEPNLVALRGWEEPGSQHHATIDYGDATELWYRVGDGTTWGNVTGPVRIPSRLTSFAVFGDMGTYEYAPKSNALGAVDAHVAAACSSAPRRRSTRSCTSATSRTRTTGRRRGGGTGWRRSKPAASADSSRRSCHTMVGCGNHDCLYDNSHKPPWAGSILSAGEDGGQCGVPYNARFKMPGDPTQIDGWHESRNGTRNDLFYSFDVGSVHFVMLSSEHDLGDGSAQLAWLAADLAAVDRSRTPFVLVGLHRPVYTSTKLGIKLPETKGQQAALEPLLLQYRVSAVFAGHYHQYERSCPIARNACAVNGTVHVTAGIAGLQHHDLLVVARAVVGNGAGDRHLRLHARDRRQRHAHEGAGDQLRERQRVRRVLAGGAVTQRERHA